MINKLSSDEIEALERLVESQGWKVFCMKIMFPMLKLASSQLDIAKSEDFRLYQGHKQALMGVIHEVYVNTTVSSPFEAHQDALMASLYYEFDKRDENTVENNDDETLEAMLSRHSQGNKPLI